MSASSYRSIWSQRITWIQVGLAVLATEVALTPQGVNWPWERLVELLLAIPIFALIWWTSHGTHVLAHTKKPPALAIGFVVGSFLLPVLYYGILALIRREGFLLEVVLLSCLRNLAIGTTCLVQWKMNLRMSALASLFLAVYAAVLADGPWLHAIIGLYAACGCVWLLLNYWSIIPHSGAEGRFPVVIVTLIALLIGLTVVIGLVGPAKAAQALAGFLPSSGGNDRYDPDSRGGTNDGDDTVRGTQQARSTGFTDSDYFLDSPEDSLYDVTHDLYGDPIKPKDWQRMISLSGDQVLKKDLIPAENLQAGREFSLLRKPPKQSEEPLENRAAQALVYVQGRAPAHLPVTAYNQFDGILWSEAPQRTIKVDLACEGQGPWMRLQFLPETPIFASTQQHIIKVAKFKTASLPFPGHINRFRVGKINQTNFFAWAQEDILRLAERDLPKGTILESETRTIDYPRLSQCDLDWSESSIYRPYLSFPANEALEERCQKLAQEWIGNQPRGWGQIQEVIQGLRGHFTLDRSALPPSECRDVVSHFLSTHRGRDVDFATTAVLLLRTLGYPTRVVSGFYVHPDHYDAKSEHFLVYKEDVHFWPEVLLDHKAWVALEPTPGYELATPVYSWFGSLVNLGTALWQGLSNHPVWATLGLFLFGVICWLRHEIADRLVIWLWQWGRRRSLRREVLRTVRLMDRRAAIAGRPRPKNKTAARWYCLLCQSDCCDHAIGELLQMSIWAAYAPGMQDQVMPWQPETVYSTCSEVVRHWNLRQFRRTTKSSTPVLSL